jgi:hypothetical protein
MSSPARRTSTLAGGEFGAKILNKFKIYFSKLPTPISELIVLSLLKVPLMAGLKPCATKCKLLNALDNMVFSPNS